MLDSKWSMVCAASLIKVLITSQRSSASQYCKGLAISYEICWIWLRTQRRRFTIKRIGMPWLRCFVLSFSAVGWIGDVSTHAWSISISLIFLDEFQYIFIVTKFMLNRMLQKHTILTIQIRTSMYLFRECGWCDVIFWYNFTKIPQNLTC